MVTTLIAAAVVLGGAAAEPPSPGRAALRAAGPAAFTARLVAAAEDADAAADELPAPAGREDEVEELEQDLRDTRGTTAAPAADALPETEPETDVRRRGATEVPNAVYQAGSYRTWSILWWLGAAAAWGGGAFNTYFSLSWWGKAAKDRDLSESERRNIFTGGDPDGWNRDEYRDAAIVTTVGAVILTAAGSVMAWLAGRNFASYRELDAQLQLEARAQRGAPDWDAPIAGWSVSPPPPPAAPVDDHPGHHHARDGGWERYDEHRHEHSREGSWDRYDKRPPAEGEPGAPVKPTKEFDPDDPEWKEYLEHVKQRREALEKKRTQPEDALPPPSPDG